MQFEDQWLRPYYVGIRNLFSMSMFADIQCFVFQRLNLNIIGSPNTFSASCKLNCALRVIVAKIKKIKGYSSTLVISRLVSLHYIAVRMFVCVLEGSNSTKCWRLKWWKLQRITEFTTILTFLKLKLKLGCEKSWLSWNILHSDFINYCLTISLTRLETG